MINTFLKLVAVLLYALAIICGDFASANEGLNTASAESPKDYFREHIIGWHWYNERIITKPKEKKEIEKTKGQLEAIPPDPTAQMATIRKIIERSLNKAILDPTVDNIRDYIALQNKISNQSTKFANSWQKTLLAYPGLNYSFAHPTNMAAKQIYLDAYQDKETKAIVAFFKNKGMFFFYSSTCPYCQKFAPIIKAFAQKYDIALVPITIDGISLPEFPNSRSDLGQAKKFKVNSFPALFAVNPYSDKALPISYGFISESDLRQRILDLATDFKNDL